MKCHNCGFEFDEGNLCPICGAEYIEQPPEPLEVEEAEQSGQATKQPIENEHAPAAAVEQASKTKANKMLLIILTAVICAVMIISSAAVCVFFKMQCGKLRDEITDSLNKKITDAVNDSYNSGWNYGWDGALEYIESADRSTYEDISDYETHELDDTVKLGDLELTLTDCTTTKDTLSADKERCEMTFTVELLNRSGDVMELSDAGTWVYNKDTMYYSQSEAMEFSDTQISVVTMSSGSGEVESIASGSDYDFSLDDGDKATLTLTVTGPKVDNAVLAVNLTETFGKKYYAAEFNAVF